MLGVLSYIVTLKYMACIFYDKPCVFFHVGIYMFFAVFV